MVPIDQAQPNNQVGNHGHQETTGRPVRLEMCKNLLEHVVRPNLSRARGKRDREPVRKNPNPKLSTRHKVTKRTHRRHDRRSPVCLCFLVDDAVCSMSRRWFVSFSGLELVSYPWYRPIKKPAAHRTPIGRQRPP